MEEKIKKRDWVKNAAIIFLAVLLVLTFFSNTIMNRTLPEVMTHYIDYGSIDSKVRISGTVSARENYDVIIDQTRKVASVSVKIGQSVSTGDLLFTLENGDSEELEAAKKDLEQLQLNYKRALINASYSDYSQENRTIEQAREALEKAQEKQEELYLDPEEINAAKARVADAEGLVTDAKAEVTRLSRELKAAQYGFNHSSDGSDYGGGGNFSSLYSAISAAEKALNDAGNNRSAAYLVYGTDYDTIKQAAADRIAADKAPEVPTEAETARLLPYYLELVAEEYGNADPADPEYDAKQAQLVAYTKITEAETAYADAGERLDSARTALRDAESNVTYDGGYNYEGKSHSYYEKEINRLEPLIEDAQEKQETAEAFLAAKNEELQKLNERQAEYETAGREIQTCENTLEDLLFNLEQQKKADGRSQQIEALDRQEMQKEIAEAEEYIAQLSGADTGATEVYSKVNGTVESLSISSGHKAEAGAILVSIEVPDMGYTLTTSVSNDQAKMLHVGDSANVNNYYWGSKTVATVASMAPDPKDPRTSRLVTFDITGNVNNGDSLSFSIGERNANYDNIVPNSAIRSDSKGTFVLIITAKNSPLGNRYYATRVDVTVLASDDYNTAIDGAFNYMDSVITTSGKNAPVSNGDQVRLSDNNNI